MKDLFGFVSFFINKNRSHIAICNGHELNLYPSVYYDSNSANVVLITEDGTLGHQITAPDIPHK